VLFRSQPTYTTTGLTGGGITTQWREQADQSGSKVATLALTPSPPYPANLKEPV
jgi:hypothetical protein